VTGVSLGENIVRLVAGAVGGKAVTVTVLLSIKALCVLRVSVVNFSSSRAFVLNNDPRLAGEDTGAPRKGIFAGARWLSL
jgi:hypothetical protein